MFAECRQHGHSAGTLVFGPGYPSERWPFGPESRLQPWRGLSADVLSRHCTYYCVSSTLAAWKCEYGSARKTQRLTATIVSALEAMALPARHSTGGGVSQGSAYLVHLGVA